MGMLKGNDSEVRAPLSPRSGASMRTILASIMAAVIILIGLGYLTSESTGITRQLAMGSTAVAAFFSVILIVGLLGSRKPEKSATSNESEWRAFLANAPLEDMPEFREAAEHLVMKDTISVQKWIHNLTFLLNPAHADAFLVQGMPVTPSPSALKMAYSSARPLMPLWFLAAYPDVAVWPNEQIRAAASGDSTAVRLLDEWCKILPDESAMANSFSSNTINDVSTLRMLVDAYRSVTCRKLECEI
jgi:hypothetical protein